MMPSSCVASPSVRETVEVVQAVRDGNDPRNRTLLADLAVVADTAAVLYLWSG